MASRSHDLTTEIISKLNIRHEYEKLGIKIAANQPNANGWLGCYAFGREDKNQSAAINVNTGTYTDRGSGLVNGLFDFAVHVGKFTDWKAARKHYATVAGMAARLPKKENSEAKRADERIDIQPGWNPILIRGLLQAYPGITNLALQMADSKLAMFPPRSKQKEHVVAIPVYGPHLVESPPISYVIQSTSGRKITPKTGGDPQKRLVIGPTGMLNRRGLTMILDHRAELVIKTEGVSDFLTLQSAIAGPDGSGRYLNRIAVTTNACGANETTLPGEIAGIFAGIPTVILHDADVPGQDGAKLWLTEVGKFTKVVNLQLPYAIEEKHGKDVRDWLNEGHSVDDLLELIRFQFPGFLNDFDKGAPRNGHSKVDQSVERTAGDAEISHSGGNVLGHGQLVGNETGSREAEAESRTIQKSPQSATGHHSAPEIGSGLTQWGLILKRIGMIVLGKVENTSDVMAFCERDGHTFTLTRISYLQRQDLLVHLGEGLLKELNESNEPDPTKLTLGQIRDAIAVEGSKRTLTGASYFGVGIWDVGGRLLIVNAGEATIVNGDVSRTTVPIIENQIFDFGESQKWFDHSWFLAEFDRNESREYSMSVLNEAIEIFARWDNWRHKSIPEVLAALVCCTWIQNVWDWRPQVCITGPTNSGKTILIRTIRAMFANGKMTCGGMSPSAAGIRQKLKSTSKAVIIDEFEPNSKHRRECLEMFRGMSRGDAVSRGTTKNNNAVEFAMKHLPWHGAISAEVKAAADRNRYVMIELDHVKKGRGSTLKVPTAKECCDIGMKLMVIACKYWQAAKTLAIAINQAHVEKVDRRLVESFSVPCGMLGAVMGLSQDEAVGLMREVIGEQDLADQSESDEQNLLRDIFEAAVQLEGGKQATMSMLVKGTFGSAYGANDAMIRCGVRKVESRDGSGQPMECLFFVESSICANLFRDPEKRNMGVAQILSRIPGMVKCRQYMGTHRPSGIMIPISTVENMLGVIEGDSESSLVKSDPMAAGNNASASSVIF